MNRGSIAGVCSSVELRCTKPVGLISAVLLAAMTFGQTTIAGASTIDTVYSFTGGADGSAPSTALVAGPQGALYGANQTTVYRVKLDSGKWTVTPIYATPSGPAKSLASYGGSLYVALDNVGKPCPQNDLGCGEIIELTPPASSGPWKAATVYAFKGDKDGVSPTGITVSTSGTIYGVTTTGGNATACGSGNNIQTGCGTLFQIEKVNGAWQEKVLVAFNGTNGAFPEAAPVVSATSTTSAASAGSSQVNVYASTNQGGQLSAKDESCFGYGVILHEIVMEKGGGVIAQTIAKELLEEKCKNPIIVAYFVSEVFPSPKLLGDSLQSTGPSTTSANWVIATGTGGGNVNDCPALANSGCGVVFMLTEPTNGSTPWTFTSLHKFSGPPDGAFPQGFLLQDGANTLYGVTTYGGTVNTQCGANGCGTIYKLTNGKSGWTWGGIAYKLPGGSHGADPAQGLTLYQNKIVGVTNAGGSGCAPYGCGTIFVFTP